MEKIIDKFIKKYFDDLRYYALKTFETDRIPQIYFFKKNGHVIVKFDIYDHFFYDNSIQVYPKINRRFYVEISNVLGVTEKNDRDLYLKNKSYFLTQSLNVISPKVENFLNDFYDNTHINVEHPDLIKIDMVEKDLQLYEDEYTIIEF